MGPRSVTVWLGSASRRTALVAGPRASMTGRAELPVGQRRQATAAAMATTTGHGHHGRQHLKGLRVGGGGARGHDGIGIEGLCRDGQGATATGSRSGNNEWFSRSAHGEVLGGSCLWEEEEEGAEESVDL